MQGVLFTIKSLMAKLLKNLNNASRKGRLFGSDQVALAISLFEDNLDFEPFRHIAIGCVNTTCQNFLLIKVLC